MKQYYDEYKMAEAVIEYDRLQTVSALEVAERFGVPVAELHKAYAAHRASIDKLQQQPSAFPHTLAS